MDFMQLAKSRYSVRKYQDRPVEQDKLQRILEAGRVCPTAANKQPQRFLVVSSPEGLAKLGKSGNIHGAPLAIVVCCVKAKAWVRPFDGQDMVYTDASIVATHLMLKACEEGLGSCWIDMFDTAVVAKEFKLPEGTVAVHVLALGYADGQPASPERHAKDRLPLEELMLE